MSTTFFVRCAFLLAVLCGSAALAQTPHLRLSGGGLGLTPSRDNTDSHILMTDSLGGTKICNINTVCNTTGLTGTVSSTVIYDNTREKMLLCNGEPPASDGELCSRVDGIVTASLQVRTGKIKVHADQATGYLNSLNTSNAGVWLEFGNGKRWWMNYVSNITNDFRPAPAGTFTIVADPLAAHCQPVQSNPGLAVSVPEGGEVETTVFFAPTECLARVQRKTSDSAYGGTVESDPPGLTCGASPTSECTGRFPYGTTVTLIPVPNPGSTFYWPSGSGCPTGAVPCTRKYENDNSNTFEVRFSKASSSTDGGVSDAGAEPEDAGHSMEDGGGTVDDAGTSAGDAGAQQADAGAQGGGDGGTSQPQPSGDPSEDEPAGCSTTSGLALPVLALLLGLLFARMSRPKFARDVLRPRR